VTYLAVALSIALFLVCFWVFRVVPAAAAIVASARGAFAALRDPQLTDDAKETAAQRASLALLGGLFSILLRAAAAVAVSLAPPLAFAALGLASLDDTYALLASWEVIAVTTVAMVVGFVLSRRRGGAQNSV
jgi:hypothetical protein